MLPPCGGYAVVLSFRLLSMHTRTKRNQSTETSTCGMQPWSMHTQSPIGASPTNTLPRRETHLI
jgi:hypothetical protein